MKFEEALKLLREGKKIRRSCWRNDIYLALTKDGATAYVNGEPWIYGMSIETILNTDWEVLEEPILDEKEKEYLSNIIKPFRDKVDYITKVRLLNKIEYIDIEFKDDANICFPSFKANTMYKGMEPDKKYTLKELGL